MHNKYQQHAADTFPAKLVQGTNHCGIHYGDGSAQFKYVVDIDYASDRAKDERGFLLDNTAFHQYFTSLPPIDISCEDLAEKAKQAFLAMLGERASYVCKCHVRIYPFGDVYVAAISEGDCSL